MKQDNAAKIVSIMTMLSIIVAPAGQIAEAKTSNYAAASSKTNVLTNYRRMWLPGSINVPTKNTGDLGGNRTPIKPTQKPELGVFKDSITPVQPNTGDLGGNKTPAKPELGVFKDSITPTRPTFQQPNTGDLGGNRTPVQPQPQRPNTGDLGGNRTAVQPQRPNTGDLGGNRTPVQPQPQRPNTGDLGGNRTAVQPQRPNTGDLGGNRTPVQPQPQPQPRPQQPNTGTSTPIVNNVINNNIYIAADTSSPRRPLSACNNLPYPSDIDGDWSEIYVRRLFDLCIVQGFRDGTYRPHQFVTRAELTKMALFSRRIQPDTGCYDSDCGTPYRDLDEWQGQWLRQAWLRNIIAEKPYFEPNRPITRAEAVKVILATYGYSPLNVQKSFFNDVEGWSTGWIERAHQLGIVQGIGNGNFDPNRPVTRAEAAKMIAKLMEHWNTRIY